MLEAIRRIHNSERQVGALPEEVPVFRNQRVGAGPLDICGDEGIGGFQAFGFIFRAQFKGHDEILIDDGQALYEPDEFTKLLGRQVAADFFDDQPGDSQGISGWFGKRVKERFAGGLSRDAEAEDEFVGVKYEQQISCPKALLLFCGEFR